LRYVLAMLCGTISAAIAATFISGPVAGWLSKRFIYESPDGQNDVEQMAFLGIMIVAMAIGWAIGWAIGSPYARRERLD
jgi:predicted acyltransferase